MIRPALICAMLLVSGSAWAQETASWSQVKTEPCRGYLMLYGTQLFDRIELPLADEFLSRRGGDRFGSTCNITDYVKAECESNRGMTVGDAVNDLFDKQRKHRKLPHIPQCGA